MAEGEQKESIPRRRFLKAGVAAIAAGAGISILADKETQVAREGIDTPHGKFIPLYEQHIEGLSKGDIPDDLDIFFVEFVWGAAYGVDPKTLLSRVASGGYAGGQKLKGEEEIIEKLAQNGTRVMFADIEEGSSAILVAAEGLTALLAEGGAFAYFMHTQSKKTEKPDQLSSLLNKKVTRGALIKGAAKGAFHLAAAWAAAPLVTSIFSGPANFLDQQSALRRISIRITGLQSHLHPEAAVVFFRNAVIADKLLTAAEVENKEKQRKPKIGFNMGSGHSGIEDFLKLGSEFCRLIITSYSKDYLKDVTQLNGGIENFSSLRLLSLPKDLKAEDFKDPERMEQLTISEQVLHDEKLAKQIETKLQ